MPTLKDVASRAGVSFKTVSRVVNEDAAVHAETRERVAAVIREIGYVPDGRARAMRAGRSNVVALVTDRIATTPYSVGIVRGAHRAVAAAGLTLIIADTEGCDKTLAAIMTRLEEARVEGIVYATMFHRKISEKIASKEALVYVNCFGADDTPALVPDDKAAQAEATAYLIGLGHRSIAYVTLPGELVATQLRLAGYRRTMEGSGLVPQVIEGKLWNDGAEKSVAFERLVELLRKPDRPTAIMVGNDEQAMAAYAAAQAVGLSIPDDLSVVGFDDNTMICEGLRPTLTTMALPYVAMGARSIDLLLGLDKARGTIKVPCPLVLRQSTAAPSK